LKELVRIGIRGIAQGFIGLLVKYLNEIMNREIKFRAWDNKRKEWYGAGDPSSLTLYDFHIFGECMYFSMPPVGELGDIIVSQFTGLKDKNGKEIYEGDIVRTTRLLYGEDGGGMRGVVEYKAPSFVAVRKGKAQNISLESNDLEVIGNIYKNPELIKCK
jgi:uncharacterized phage protein (TIGR01671 family)